MSSYLTYEQFPTAYVEFLRLFNDGQYWHSHEALEGLWLQNRSTFYKGLIIYASAFVHAQRGNPLGVLKQSIKARRYLQEYVPAYLGLDIERLLAHIEKCLQFVAGDTPPEGNILTKAFPYDRLELSPKFVRGDEPELTDDKLIG